ncbi:hypothetical protein PINS_up009526 [Pythium insidiosum]|nr:hypothetical protein PINS_up009526 [Pythium insidiosum]
MTCAAVLAPMHSHGLVPGAVDHHQLHQLHQLHHLDVAATKSSSTSPKSQSRTNSLRRQRSTDEIEASSFRVISELGRGLQGRVDLAFDVLENRLVAIKRPVFSSSPSNADTVTATERACSYLVDCQIREIIRERNALRLVSHDNVLRYVRSTAGYEHDKTYLVLATEYASNGDLFDLISKTGALPERVAKVYFRQLMRAVQACHRSGVIHRDIKPENILFDDQFTLKLCDFGLASIVSPATGRVEDAWLSDVEGTTLYMAPEIESGEPFRGTPVDVWACGVVLFILLTGYPPFDEPTPDDFWFDCIVDEDMTQFWESQPDAVARPGSAAVDLINRLLCVDPDRRITVADVLAHPWLADTDDVDREAVIAEMSERRKQSSLRLSDVE